MKQKQKPLSIWILTINYQSKLKRITLQQEANKSAKTKQRHKNLPPKVLLCQQTISK